MVSIIGCPKVVVSVYAQTMRVREESIANTLNEVAHLVIFGEHGLGSLEQKYVALRIYRDPRGFAGHHSFGELEKIRNDAIGKFGNGLELCGLR